MKICTITSRFRKLQYGLFCHTTSCSMTFCFSFDVLMKLNPKQVNLTGGGPTQ